MILSVHPMTLTVARIQQQEMLAEAARRRRARQARKVVTDVVPVGSPDRPWQPFRRLRDLATARVGQPHPAR